MLTLWYDKFSNLIIEQTMIHLFGADGTQEYEAALDLRQRILESWPEIEHDARNRITIVVGVQCHGQKVRDVDLILLAHFEDGILFEPLFPFHQGADQEHPAVVTLESFCVVIEVKSHSGSGVRFIGKTVEVSYGRHWHDATHQNEQQKYSFLNYLKVHHIQPPRITSLIWLRNVPNTSLPARPHNILGGNATWEMFVSTIIQMEPPWQYGREWRLSVHTLTHGDIKEIADLLTRKLEPTKLDRRRMEQISERIILEQQNLPNIVGQQLLILRGRGGTGKTIRLLQLAKYFYETEAARVLILTYNKALVADLRRLLTIMGVGDYTAQSSIQIQTVHSFFYAILSNLNLIESGSVDFLQNYATYKQEAVEMLSVGAVTMEDMAALVIADRFAFGWDYIFIDEGQDWPQDERDILFALYPHPIFVVADGVDQLIRSAEPADWRGILNRTEYTVRSLKRCLRMKAGLTRFVSTFAEQMGLPQSEWRANDEVPGGRVIVLDGLNPLADRHFFEDLVAKNREAGNRPVDMLYCVPPNMVTHISEDDAISQPAELFQSWGWPVWDGASPAVRDTYPTQLNQRRIVQYDSCRGLEGWTVVNFGLDLFYDYKLRQTVDETSGVAYDEALARNRAVRWLMIPLTRAMDTLVIHLHQAHSPVRDALQAVAQHHTDFVEWRS